MAAEPAPSHAAKRLVDPRPLTWMALLARRTAPPVPDASYPHDCRATRPGIIPWLLFLLAATWAVANLVSQPPLGGLLPRAGPAVRVALTALAVLMAFWLIGWEWRRTPRGIALGLGDRNVASLSVGQAIAWTILLIAVTVVAILSATGAQAVDSLGTLQAGLGVGTAAGSALALSGKSRADATPTTKAIDATARLARERAPAPYVRDVVRGTAGGPGLREAARAAQAAAVASGRSPQQALKQAESVLASVAQGVDPARVLRKHGLKGDSELAKLLPGVPGLVEAHIGEALAEARTGALYANGCPCEARLKDMLQGDETSNAYQLDPNKLQFIALTLLGMFVYAATVLQRLEQPFGLGHEYPGGMLAALGLSSASYVGVKLPIQTPLEPET